MLIGEVARRSGLSKDTLRRYEEIGLLHSAPVRAGSRTYRDYDDSTLERLSLIRLAKRLGFGLRELAGLLDGLLSDAFTEEERRATLLAKLAEVDRRIADLAAARDLLKQIAETPHKPFVDARLKALGYWID